MASFGQTFHACRSERHAVFFVLDFPDDANLHGNSPDSSYLNPYKVRLLLRGAIRDELAWPEHMLHAHEETRSKAPGNIVIVTLTFEHLTEVPHA